MKVPTCNAQSFYGGGYIETFTIWLKIIWQGLQSRGRKGQRWTWARTDLKFPFSTEIWSSWSCPWAALLYSGIAVDKCFLIQVDKNYNDASGNLFRRDILSYLLLFLAWMPFILLSGTLNSWELPNFMKEFTAFTTTAKIRTRISHVLRVWIFLFLCIIVYETHQTNWHLYNPGGVNNISQFSYHTEYHYKCFTEMLPGCLYLNLYFYKYLFNLSVSVTPVKSRHTTERNAYK